MHHANPARTPSRRAPQLDYARPFLPTGLSLADEAAFLAPGERRTLSQVQARTFAATAALLERIAGTALLGARGDRPPVERAGVEAVLRAAGAKLRRRERLRELEAAMAGDMPPGHAMRPGAFAQKAQRAGAWASRALALLQEHSRLAQRQAFEVARDAVCPAWRDAIALHEADGALDATVAREFARAQAELDPVRRDEALDEFLALVADLQAALAAQSRADARYFIELSAPRRAPEYEAPLAALLARAYRWQFLVAGALERGFRQPFYAALDPRQAARVREAFSSTAAPGTAARLAVAA